MEYKVDNIIGIMTISTSIMVLGSSHTTSCGTSNRPQSHIGMYLGPYIWFTLQNQELGIT